jgi:predicted dehydrogenase
MHSVILCILFIDVSKCSIILTMSTSPASNHAVRVGIVGSGFAARFHYNAFTKVHGGRVPGLRVEVAGVWSPNEANRRKFAAERGLTEFASFESLCDAVDVVDACVPGNLHEPMACAALGRGRHVIVEKPFTGYYGDGSPDFRGETFSKEIMMREALASAQRLVDAERASGKQIYYAENWVYAPAVAKEREIIEKSGGQVLRILGEESHSGSHSPFYGIWSCSGGGSLLSKGCHPLTAALYLKSPVRPAAVSCRTHAITKLPAFQDLGHLRTGYKDIEDYATIHVIFEDGMVADIFASELVLGGVANWIEVYATNHRTRCNLNPVDALTTYNPKEDYFADIYVVEKTGTKQGWSHPAPDEDWQHGYPQEMQDFMECAATPGRAPLCGSQLGRDTIAVLYAGYLSAERHGAEVRLE